MKKALKFVFFGLLLLVVSYYAFTKYQSIASLKGVVHKDAVSIVKIGAQEIKESLILDALGSPGYYLENIKNEKEAAPDKEEKPSVETGVDFAPHNILIFTLPNHQNTSFVTLKIKDRATFEAFLKKSFHKKLEIKETLNEKGFQTAKFKEVNIFLGWNEEKLIVAGALKTDFDSLSKVFKDLLIDDKFITKTSHPLLKQIRRNKGHIVYVNSSGTTALNFEDGRAILEGSHTTGVPFAKEVVVPSYSNSSISFHFDTIFNEIRKQDLRERLNSTSFLKKDSLNTATIFNYLKGAVSFAINGKTIQKDTIITYMYDDNFEKVEQKSIQKNEVPIIHLDLETTSNGLLDHLNSAGKLTPEGVFKSFPLYQFKVSQKDKRINLSTSFDNLEIDKKSSAYFFQVQTNFERLQDDLGFIETEPLFSLLDNLNIYAWQATEDQFSINGEINAKDDKVNILSQLFFGIKKQTKLKPEEAKL